MTLPTFSKAAARIWISLDFMSKRLVRKAWETSCCRLSPLGSGLWVLIGTSDRPSDRGRPVRWQPWPGFGPGHAEHDGAKRQ